MEKTAENRVKDQEVTENYAIYNSDCMLVLPTLKEKSIDLVVYSPPFAGLYNYSSSENDFSNCENKEQFLEQYDFLVKELYIYLIYHILQDYINML
jgi:tRNA1(Val) A37 N6-methylase TrmN6